VVEGNPDYLSDTAVKNVYGHYPAGGSWRQLNHFRQMLFSKEFKMYDHDFDSKTSKKNLEVYGQDSPPMYPLHTVTDYPILMVCGKSDKLCMPGDYLHLYDLLRSQNACVGKIETEFGHLSLLNPKYK